MHKERINSAEINVVFVVSYLFVSPFENDSESPMSDQVFPAELKFSYSFHVFFGSSR